MHAYDRPTQIYHGLMYNLLAFLILYCSPSWLTDGHPYVSRCRSLLLLVLLVNLTALVWKLAHRVLYRSTQIHPAARLDRTRKPPPCLTKSNVFGSPTLPSSSQESPIKLLNRPHSDEGTAASLSPQQNRTPIRPFVTTGNAPTVAMAGSPLGNSPSWPSSPLTGTSPSFTNRRIALASPSSIQSSSGIDRSTSSNQMAAAVTVATASPPPLIYRVGRTSHTSPGSVGVGSGGSYSPLHLLSSPSKSPLTASASALTFYNPFGASTILTPPASLTFLSAGSTWTSFSERNHAKLKAWFKSTLLLPLLAELVSLDGWLESQGSAHFGCRRFPFLRPVRSQSGPSSGAGGGQDYKIIPGREDATERLRTALLAASSAIWQKRLLLEKFLCAASVAVSLTPFSAPLSATATTTTALDSEPEEEQEERKRQILCERLVAWSTGPISIKKTCSQPMDAGGVPATSGPPFCLSTSMLENESGQAFYLDDEALLLHLFAVFMDARMPESESYGPYQSGAFSRQVLLYEPLPTLATIHRNASSNSNSNSNSSSNSSSNSHRLFSSAITPLKRSSLTSRQETEPLLRFDLFPIRFVVAAKSNYYYVLCDHRQVALVPSHPHQNSTNSSNASSSNHSFLPSTESSVLESLLYTLSYLQQEWSGYLGLSYLGSRPFDILQVVHASESTSGGSTGTPK